MKRYITRGKTIDTTLTIKPSDFSRDPGFVSTMTYRELDDYIKLLQFQGSDELKLFLIEKVQEVCQPVRSLYSYSYRGITFIKEGERRYRNEYRTGADTKLFLYPVPSVCLTILS